MPELHVREMTLRAAPEGDKREFSGIAVPYDVETEIRDWFGEYVEVFARGAVQDSDGAKVFWRHDEPIGRITSARDTDAGWEITGVLSRTPRGDEAYELLRDGVIDRMSVGFDFGEYREEHDVDADTVRLVHERVHVREVSLVPFPAYDGAKVATVRHRTPPSKEPAMPPEADTLTRADLAPLNETLEEHNRSLELIKAGIGTATPPEPAFRSIGEYVHALVSGDETAKRAFDGAVSGDGILEDQWIGDIVELQSQAQPVLNTFSKGTLPAKGLTVEWGLLEDDTTDFDRQLAEGDNLVHGKVSLTTDNAPVYTAGGYSSLSVQAIQRTTNINLLDTTWEALALKAARYTERLARATATAAYNARLAADDPDERTTITADLTTASGIITALIDLVEHYDDSDLLLSGLYVSKDVFLSLYDVEAVDSILQVSGTAPNKVGTLNVKAIEAELAGLQVKLYPGAAAGTVFAYDSRSVKTLEAPGSPFRLTNDINVVDLTKPIGLYTYVSAFAQRPAGIVPLVDTDPVAEGGGGGGGGEG